MTRTKRDRMPYVIAVIVVCVALIIDAVVFGFSLVLNIFFGAGLFIAVFVHVGIIFILAGIFSLLFRVSPSEHITTFFVGGPSSITPFSTTLYSMSLIRAIKAGDRRYNKSEDEKSKKTPNKSPGPFFGRANTRSSAPSLQPFTSGRSDAQRGRSIN
jgi:hypothetical protein